MWTENDFIPIFELKKKKHETWKEMGIWSEWMINSFHVWNLYMNATYSPGINAFIRNPVHFLFSRIIIPIFFSICYLLIFKDFKLPTSKHGLDLSFWTEIFHRKQHILYFTHRYIILRRKWRQRKNNIIIITIKYERVCVFIFILFFLMKKMEKIKKNKNRL